MELNYKTIREKHLENLQMFGTNILLNNSGIKEISEIRKYFELNEMKTYF